MRRSSHGVPLLAACAVLWACSPPHFDGGTPPDATSPLALCDGGACESASSAKDYVDAAVEGSTSRPREEPRDSAQVPPIDGAPSPAAPRSDGAAQPSPGSQGVIDDGSRDAGAEAGAPTSASGTFCSSAPSSAFCSDFESSDENSGFDYRAIDPEAATAKLVEATQPGHDRRVLELSLTAATAAKYVWDFADEESAVRIEFDVWVKSPPRSSDEPLEIAKVQQEVPPDGYPGLSLLVHAEGASILIGNTVRQSDAGTEYVGTSFDLPPLADKWTRVRLDVWLGLSGRVRVSYDGVEQLDRSGVRIDSDNATNTYATLGLYASKIGAASVWYDNVIVSNDF